MSKDLLISTDFLITILRKAAQCLRAEKELQERVASSVRKIQVHKSEHATYLLCKDFWLCAFPSYVLTFHGACLSVLHCL